MTADCIKLWPLGECSGHGQCILETCDCAEGWSSDGDYFSPNACQVNRKLQIALNWALIACCGVLFLFGLRDLVRSIQMKRFSIRKAPGIIAVNRVCIPPTTCILGALQLSGYRAGKHPGVTTVVAFLLAGFWAFASAMNSVFISDLMSVFVLDSKAKAAVGQRDPVLGLLRGMRLLSLIATFLMPLIVLPMILMPTETFSDHRETLAIAQFVCVGVTCLIIGSTICFAFWRASLAILQPSHIVRMPPESQQSRRNIAKLLKRMVSLAGPAVITECFANFALASIPMLRTQAYIQVRVPAIPS